MMAAVAAAQGQQPRPRPPLKALFQSDADILPGPEQGILRVRILGTSLRLVYELPPNPSLNLASGSRS